MNTMEDNIMSDDEIARATGHSLFFMRLPINRKRLNECRETAKAQNKISFKAVYEAARNKKTMGV